MKVAIIDDELHCIESLVMDLKSVADDIEIVFKSKRPEEAIERLQSTQLDLLFLDVEMPGINGFELLEQIGDLKFDVIFTTAYSQYAVQAFKYKAFNYLLKPVDVMELQEVIKEWKEQKADNGTAGREETVMHFLKQMKKEGVLRSKIAVPISDGYEFLEVSEIIYCQSENNYANIYLWGGRKVLISKTLKEVEKTLSKHLFIRIHQSFLVNPSYLKKYQRKDGGYVTLQNDHKLPVSNQKKELLTGLFEAVSRNC